MAELGGIDYLFVVPSSSVHRIQEAQTTIYHVLWELTVAAVGRPGGPAPARVTGPAPAAGHAQAPGPAPAAGPGVTL
jgi:hypothetical protein